MNRTFSSLSIYNYRMWFIGALVANIGTWMQRIAQDWLVLTELTDNSGFAVGIVTALQFIPAVLLTPLAGVLTDRFNRRKILILTQTALGLLAASLGAMVLAGVAVLWHVYVFALLLGVVSALDAPARQVFVSELVPANRLANAVGLNSASFNAARLIGPGIAGLGIAAVGTGWIFIVNAASFAATILAMWAMRVADLRTPKPALRRKGQLREGIAYVRHRSDIVVIMVTVFVVSALGMNFQLTSAVMAREVFQRGAGEYGIMGSIMAIGSLAGALAALRVWGDLRVDGDHAKLLDLLGYVDSGGLLRTYDDHGREHHDSAEYGPHRPRSGDESLPHGVFRLQPRGRARYRMDS